MSTRLPKILLGALVVYAVVYFLRSYDRLPPIVISHFDAQGKPNGWEAKPIFFAICSVFLGVAGIIGVGGPWLMRVLPPELINLPNKEQWLSPAHRETTMNFLSTWFAWFGCGLLLLQMLVFSFAVQTNLHPAHPPESARLWYYLAGFGIFTAIWVARLATRFARPRSFTANSQ